MDPTVGNLISVGIGAFVSFLGVILSNWLLMRKEREQWNREHKAEHEKWIRDKLQEIYSNCIYYLGHTPNVNRPWQLDRLNSDNFVRDASVLEIEKLRAEYEQVKLGYQQMELDVSKLNIEFANEKQRWLNLLVVYHPFRGTSEFDEFLTKMREQKLGIDDVTELSARDPRLHIDIGKLSSSHKK